MATTSPMGISPALLQAISHLQKSRAQAARVADGTTRITLDKGGSEHVIITTSGASDVPHFQLGSTTTSSGSHLLQGMNEPVPGNFAQGEEQTIYVMQGDDAAASMEVVETETLSQHEETPASPGSQLISVAEPPAEHVAVVANGNREDTADEVIQVASDKAAADLNMGSVLSAIAKSLQQKQREVSDFMQDSSTAISSPLLIANNTSTHSIKISHATTGEFTALDAADHAVVMQQGNSTADSPAAKRIRIAEATTETHNGATTTFVVNPKHLRVPSLNLKAEPGAQVVYRTVNTEDGIAVQAKLVVDPSQMCPICGDKISGYHYGTYTCESCKGFFKRTVQNKKAFICHRKGECSITMANRKKCPACRFKLCLSMGMRVEAIREDRARGGRSSYEGCSPHGRPKTQSVHSYDAKETRKIIQITDPNQQAISVAPIASMVTVTTGPQIPNNTNSNVIVETEAANEGTPISMVTPVTPQILEDLTAVESLMMEEEEEQACCAGRLTQTDTNMFGSLLHIADHCLYRIVRWARNLPDFANVSTDDQILLLQNCWAELLCICTCWSSIHSPGLLRLSYGRTLSLEQAQAIGVGDLVERMLNFTEVLRHYETDMHEFVAIKALLLLTPDVKSLRNEGVIRQQQEQLLDALTSYTTTHYPKCPEKFSHLLALLPQLSRCCILGKEQLNKRQEAGEVPAYSLLSELLKGDSAMQ